jgi:DNA-binding FadR family transcriptional regulator
LPADIALVSKAQTRLTDFADRVCGGLPNRCVRRRRSPRAAAIRIDAAALSRLEKLIVTMREAASRDDHRAQASADAAFHHTIIAAAGNRILEHLWQTMRLSVTTCVTHSVTHRSLHEIAERHVVVLDALRAHNPVRAEAEIRRHIEEPGEWIRAAAHMEKAVPGNASQPPEEIPSVPAAKTT